MAACRRVYDSRHLQAESQEPGSAPEPIRSVIEYGLTFFYIYHTYAAPRMCERPFYKKVHFVTRKEFFRI